MRILGLRVANTTTAKEHGSLDMVYGFCGEFQKLGGPKPSTKTYSPKALPPTLNPSPFSDHPVGVGFRLWG